MKSCLKLCIWAKKYEELSELKHLAKKYEEKYEELSEVMHVGKEI